MNRQSGRFAFFRQLIADGITCMFGNPGTSEQNLLDVLSDDEFRDFKYYMALHEGPAVAMADAFARAQQRPAVVQLHSYAGLANGLGMMYYAKRGYTPLVIIAGEAGIKYDAMDGQMAADLAAIARPFVKSDHNGPCAWRVSQSDSLLRILRRAIKAASTHPRGPVFLSLPMDILEEDNFEAIVPSVLVNTNVAPERSVIQKAAALLLKATDPLILMGDGIAAAHAQDELTRVAEQLNARVYGVNNSEGNMAASHRLYKGDTGHMFGEDSLPITSGADVVLILGTTVMPEVFPHTGNIFKEGAEIIQFDLNSYEIAKNYPVTIGALADPKLALSMLLDEIIATSGNKREAKQEMLSEGRNGVRATGDMPVDALIDVSHFASANGYEIAKNYPATIGVLADPGLTLSKSPDEVIATSANINGAKQEMLAEPKNSVQPAEDKPGDALIEISDFASALANMMPENSVFFDEALTSSPEIFKHLPKDKYGSYYQTRVGMLGTGLPGTIGLKIAHPDKTVIGFCGDGGSISTIQALNTASRHGIGAKFVVCNNKSYRILKYNIKHYWKDQGGVDGRQFPKEFDLTGLDFVKLAEGHGVQGAKIERISDIEPVLERAFADDKPFLIELVLTNKL